MQLYDFQNVGVEFLRTRAGAMLTDKPGLGKTVQAVAAALAYNGPVLIISRPMNKDHWVDVIRKLDPDAPIMRTGPGGYFDLDGVKEWFLYPQTRGYLLLHHEALRIQEPRLRVLGFWSVVIADESHRFKNRKAQMTLALKSIRSYRRWALTGTPIDRTPAELWSVLNWLAPTEFSAYWRFFEKYVDYEDGYFGGRKIKGVKNGDELGRRLAPYMLGRTKEQVAPQLPPLTVVDIPIQLTPPQRELYQRLCTQYFVDMPFDEGTSREFIPNALARIQKLLWCALDPMLLNVTMDSAKSAWLLDWASSHSEKFVVFTRSRMYANTMPTLIDGVAAISGDVPQSQREFLLQCFRDNSVRGLAATIDTMGESVNLQAASLGVFTDLHRSAIAMRQAYDRLHRINTIAPVTIYRLIAKDTIDEVVATSIDKKWADYDFITTCIEHARSTCA